VDGVTVRFERVSGASVGTIDTRPYLMFEGDLHNNGGDGEGMTVAIVDTGFNLTPALKSVWAGGVNIVPGMRRDDLRDLDNHGTQVAELIHAFAPKAKLYGIKIFHDESDGIPDERAGDGLFIAAEKGDITNASIGGDTPDAHLRAAVAAHEALGNTLVASAGNSGPGVRNYPAAFEYSTAIGAWDRSRIVDPSVLLADIRPSVYSSTYPEVDGVALGRIPGLWVDGTSFSAPVVTGLLVCYMSWRKKRGLPVSDADNYEFITKHMRQLPGLAARNDQTGYGRVTMRPWRDPVKLEIHATTGQVLVNGKDEAWTIPTLNIDGHIMVSARDFATKFGIPTEYEHPWASWWL
jgi:hypothetical protein